MLPPGLTHCRSAVPPDDVRNAPVGKFPSPAALKLAVRLKLGFFTICGVPMKCGNAAVPPALVPSAVKPRLLLL